MAKCALAVDSLSQFISDLHRYTAAETRYHEFLSGVAPSDDVMIQENILLKQQLEVLQAQVNKLTDRVSRLETRLTDGSSTGASTASGDAKKPSAPAPQDGEDDVDLFGSDEEEDEAAAKIKEQRLAEYAAKKQKKPGVIAKSNVILDVKPWDDETDMAELEKCVRSVVMDGLLWGVSKLVPLAYGIKKLQITTVVEDDKVSVDELVEKIQEYEDYIQSVDIAAFNKI